MSNCKLCGVLESFQCSHCKAYFCNEHLPPHKHYCTSVSEEDIISEIVDKTTPSDSVLISVAKIIGTMFIVAVIVLAIDFVAIWLLNLSWNPDSWVLLLWLEGVAMTFFGIVEWTWQGRKYVTLPLWDDSLHRLDVGYRHHWFWVSFTMAGVVVVIAGVLIWQFI